MAPEVLRFVDRHLERRHELAMQQNLISAHGKGILKSGDLMPESYQAATLDALKESWRQQFNTGRRWLDTVSILVRPGTTYTLLGIYALTFAFGRKYDESDLALLSGILSYWFLSRSIEKRPL